MRRWWSSALATAWLIVLAVGPATAARADAPAPARTGPVVVVGVPDLRWQDVDRTRTPTLWQLAGRSSIGTMTDQSGEGDARRAAGWLTLNTGSRAEAFVPLRTLPEPSDPVQLERLKTINQAARFHSQVGALGDALNRAGRTVAAVGTSGAVLGGMDSQGRVDSRDSTVATALQHADVVMVELPQLYGVDRQDDAAVALAQTQVDDALGAILQQLPSGTSLLVAGVSDGSTDQAHLHVAMASGPAFAAGRLTSASTGRPGVVQLIDIAPTVLWLTGVNPPSAMLGVHWESIAEPRVPTATEVPRLVDLDERSVAQVNTGGRYYAAVAAVALLYVVAMVLSWVRRRAGLPRFVTAVVASIPVASWLIQLVPWWRMGTWSLAPLTAAFALVVGTVATLSPWPGKPRWRLAAVVGAVTAGVLVIDAATGSPLSLDAPFGDNPIIAGRFHGIGNVALALLASGTLLLAAALAAGSRGGRAAATVFGLGAVAVVVDGYPKLGDDFGGVLALLPAVCVLTLVVSGVRISWRYLAAVAAVTVGTVATFALVDYSRPASQRTHLGRFVQQVADGSAWPVITRKLDSSLATFTGGWPRWVTLIWVLLAVAAYVGHRQGWLRLGEDVDRRTAGGVVAALAVVGFLGAALNDSGLAITAFVLYVGVPSLVPLLAPGRTRPTGADTGRGAVRDLLPRVRNDGRNRPLRTPRG
jgi:uncharacterized protein (DUF697 family)